MKTKVLSLRISESDMEKLKQVAKKQHRSVSNIVSRCINEIINSDT